MNRNTIHWCMRISVVLTALSFHRPILLAQRTDVAIRPPLGWHTWYEYLSKVSDSDVREILNCTARSSLSSLALGLDILTSTGPPCTSTQMSHALLKEVSHG
jgi:hypothetical protein